MSPPVWFRCPKCGTLHEVPATVALENRTPTPRLLRMRHIHYRDAGAESIPVMACEKPKCKGTFDIVRRA